MTSRPGILAVALALALGCAAPAAAQYMRITTDNPTDNTRLRGTGLTTILTITLDTNHDRGPNADGSGGALQSCNSHTAANGCGATTTPQNLDMFSYTLALKAVAGTVQWGTFTPSDAAYTDTSPQIQSNMEVEINKSRPTGTFSPPGLNTLGTIPVTVLTGTPHIDVQIGASAINPYGFGTGFGTSCDAFAFGNTYVVGDPSDPCGNANGIAGDWFDWDGAGAPGGPDNAPVLTVPATATAAEGSAFSITAVATDPDAGDILTITVSGAPPFAPFLPVSGPSPLTAVLTGTPGFNDAGTYTIHWTATDRFALSAHAFTSLAVANTNRAPVLNPIANMTFIEGSTRDQAISGSDPDGDALTFAKVAGPTFMTVTTTSATTGNIHLAPGFTDAGTAAGTVSASDGTLSDFKSFTMTSATNRAPVLNPIANMLVSPGCAGFNADQAISGSDPDGDPLTFSKVAGPTFMSVTTTGPTTGNIHLAPGVSEPFGTSGATVRASDGTLSNDRSFTITVIASNLAPVLTQPANMTVTEGQTADQTLTGSDPCGDALAFSKVSGPAFATVSTTNPLAATGNLHLAPGFTDAGTYLVTLRVSDGALTDQKSLTVTVSLAGNHPPVLNPIANMTPPQGGTQDQAITGSDQDGDALTFSKASGPTFMTVTTTSPTTGNIHLATSIAEPVGTYGASASASDGVLSATQSFVITICLGCERAPVLTPVANMTVTEGMTADQAISATDPDGNPITFSKASGPIFMTVSTTNPGAGSATGNIHLAPGLADAGTYNAVVAASDGTLADSRTFTITAPTSGNRCPQPNPGGPYSGLAGVPITMNGSASSDPDGNPLTYAWDFDGSDGITVDAVGPIVTHTYTAGGTYFVSLTVTDNGDGDPNQVCTTSVATQAFIADACLATVFNGYDTVRLGSGRPFWFGYVQPLDACYTNSDVIVSTFVMKYAGRQISASGKSSVGGDKSGDGIPEIKVSFSKDDLRTLFAGTGLANGHNNVIVTLEANLVAGGVLRGETQLDVVNNGSFSVATVAPNPLNPEATLTYTTTRSGFVRIDLFDVQGRLVRRLVDEPAMAAGTHTATINGEKLPSGVYYIRGTSSEGEFRSLVTILK